MNNPTFTFTPLFFILDKARKWVMVVKKHDLKDCKSYGYKGVFLAWQGNEHGWQQWPAFMSKGELSEYPLNYDFTNNQQEAIDYAFNNSRFNPAVTIEQAHNFHGTF